MERVFVFLDYANIDRSASDAGKPVDYRDLLRYLGEGRTVVEAHCYVPLDPRNPRASDRTVEDLWTDRYLVHTKVGTISGETYKCDFDVEIAMDVMRIAAEAKPDIVAIGSGDGDFVPLILELRKRGVRVEVFGFQRTTAREIILKCSDFIDLDVYQNVDVQRVEVVEPLSQD